MRRLRRIRNAIADYLVMGIAYMLTRMHQAKAEREFRYEVHEPDGHVWTSDRGEHHGQE